MEATFITVHDLSLDARIQYVSDSVEDILGYVPNELLNRSCWEYFHPDEIPFARAIHGRGIELDKAAMLNYCQVKHRDGSWVSCECVFTVVYDVLVACTSVYRRTLRSQQRAAKAPAIRRIFSSSPRDPRYHMLSYISNKFTADPRSSIHEPRVALFINRFTRTSTIMFATNGVANVVGLEPEKLIGKSFYFCIAESCLQDAVRCIESAKANDSIAYLRFWFRNPVIAEARRSREGSRVSQDDDDEVEGGVHLDGRDPRDLTDNTSASTNIHPESPTAVSRANTIDGGNHSDHSNSSSTNSGGSGEQVPAVFEPSNLPAMSSTSSVAPQDEPAPEEEPIEVEAVVSCTSDGLVVILRKAHALPIRENSPPAPPDINSGFFASPWAPEPIIPSSARDLVPEAFGLSSVSTGSGPANADFMKSIRDVAVFAWSLTGINGSLADFSRGQPQDEAQPPDGLPIWDPSAQVSDERFNGFSDNSHRRVSDTEMREQSSTSSEDEVVYRRVPVMPAWKPVQRRGREEAFGDEADDEGDARNNSSQARRRRLDQ